MGRGGKGGYLLIYITLELPESRLVVQDCVAAIMCSWCNLNVRAKQGLQRLVPNNLAPELCVRQAQQRLQVIAYHAKPRRRVRRHQT